jgi:hypothetical protein
MQFNEREVLRYATVISGFFLLLAIAIAAVDPTAALAAADAENVQATLTCVATFAFGVFSWGLLHLRGARPSARLRAFRRQIDEE